MESFRQFCETWSNKSQTVTLNEQLTSLHCWRECLREDNIVLDVQVAITGLSIDWHSLLFYHLNVTYKNALQYSESIVNSISSSNLAVLRRYASDGRYGHPSASSFFQSPIVPEVARLSIIKPATNARRTSSTPIVSFQYNPVSFLLHPPVSFLLFTRNTISPASQSGLSSASPSYTTSWPSGIPFGISKVYCCVCEMVLWPLQCGQTFLMTLPRPPQSGQVTCACENIPGKICWRTILTPWPLQLGHVWMSFEEAAPVPRQWSHSIRF